MKQSFPKAPFHGKMVRLDVSACLLGINQRKNALRVSRFMHISSLLQSMQSDTTPHCKRERLPSVSRPGELTLELGAHFTACFLFCASSDDLDLECFRYLFKDALANYFQNHRQSSIQSHYATSITLCSQTPQ